MQEAPGTLPRGKLPSGFRKNLLVDAPASVVVFLVALPLCLGIALASGAPLISGIIAGVIGGVVVGSLSRSALGVSGPAAGLAVIVLTSIQELGAFNIFLVAVILAGLIQIGLGYARAGIIAYYFPSSVITGMLSGIGIILFLKQIPHAFGYDNDPVGELSFNQPDGETTFSELGHLFDVISPGVMIITAVSLLILIFRCDPESSSSKRWPTSAEEVRSPCWRLLELAGHRQSGSAETTMAQDRILIVEDEPDIREVMEFNLSREGFAVTVAGDGGSGLRLACEQAFDLILLDLMLPELDGLEVCRRLRERPETRLLPIIMVSAKGEESDVVLGLGLGADDYVCKPFSPRELVARVKAVLRRGQPQDQERSDSRLIREGLIIDPDRHRVQIDGQAVEFTATEMRLLHFLASRPGRVFTRDQLLEHAIGEKAVVINRNIDVHVRAIRSKLGPYRDWLETVRGVGYRFRDTDG